MKPGWGSLFVDKDNSHYLVGQFGAGRSNPQVQTLCGKVGLIGPGGRAKRCEKCANAALAMTDEKRNKCLGCTWLTGRIADHSDLFTYYCTRQGIETAIGTRHEPPKGCILFTILEREN